MASIVLAPIAKTPFHRPALMRQRGKVEEEAVECHAAGGTMGIAGELGCGARGGGAVGP